MNRVTKGRALSGELNVGTSGLLIGGTRMSATAAEIDAVADLSAQGTESAPPPGNGDGQPETPSRARPVATDRRGARKQQHARA